jgi:hypothetical protein
MPAKLYVEAANCRSISPMHHAVSPGVRLFRIPFTNSRTTSVVDQTSRPRHSRYPKVTVKLKACMPRSTPPLIPPMYSDDGVHGGRRPSPPAVSQVPRPPFALTSHHHNHHPNTHKVQCNNETRAIQPPWRENSSDQTYLTCLGNFP